MTIHNCSVLGRRNRGSKIYDACGNQLVVRKKGSSSTERLPDMVPRSTEVTRSADQKPKSILKKRDASVAVMNRRIMEKSQSFDEENVRTIALDHPSNVHSLPKSTPQASNSRPVSTSSLDTRTTSPVPAITAITRKGRKEEVEPKDRKPPKKTRTTRKDREVVVTAESLHEQEDTLNNMVETKSKNFMKKLFLLQ